MLMIFMIPSGGVLMKKLINLLLIAPFFIAVVMILPGCDGTSSVSGDSSKITWHNVGDTGEPAFQNSWANYLPTTDQPLRFGVDDYGILHIEGTLVDTTPATTSTVIFTLPSGFRPAKAHSSYITANNGGYITVAFSVSLNGNVTVGPATSTASSIFLELGHILVQL
jgi:hypothetical protein